MIVRNSRKRVINIVDAIPEAHDFYGGSLMNDKEPQGSGHHGPCIVSDKFSNEMGFCLNTTLPFLNSARGDATLTLSGFAMWRIEYYEYHPYRVVKPEFVTDLSSVPRR